MTKYFLSSLLVLTCLTHTALVKAQQAENNVNRVINLANQYCGACHAMPNPNIAPKESWPSIIQAMADLSEITMGKEFIPEDAIRDITALYYGSAAENLPRLPIYPAHSGTRRFTPSTIGKTSQLPLIANINPIDASTDKKISENKAEFIICDGESNTISLLTHAKGKWTETVVADVIAPSHTELVDYDNDGDMDILLGALGAFPPSEMLAGKVILLRKTKSGNFKKEILLEDVGRITDVRPVDVDNDGDLDIAVAVFGGGNVGEVIWLENLGNGKHKKHILVSASGALNISPVDLNNDGKVDFVSTITQEKEIILAFINKGKGQFEQIALLQAPHPMFGFTSMKTVDLDQDGDTDILLTNGDAYDTQTDPKPYHGVQWLENLGELQFKYHDIGRFYGAATAEAGDMDNDGDLDIVAASWNNYWQSPSAQSIIWYENDGKQNFQRHNIAAKPPGIVSLTVQDLNGDGINDILAGVFRIDMLLNKLSNPNKHTEALAKSVKADARFIVFENSKVTK